MKLRAKRLSEVVTKYIRFAIATSVFSFNKQITKNPSASDATLPSMRKCFRFDSDLTRRPL